MDTKKPYTINATNLIHLFDMIDSFEYQLTAITDPKLKAKLQTELAMIQKFVENSAEG